MTNTSGPIACSSSVVRLCPDPSCRLGCRHVTWSCNNFGTDEERNKITQKTCCNIKND